MSYSNGNGNGSQKIPYLPSENLVERFAGRLLRRELFEQLRDVGFTSVNVPEAKLVMFGSGVVQTYRPTGGFPVSRQAHDLDLGFVTPTHAKIERAEEIPRALQEELEDYLGSLCRKINADIEITDHGLYVRKIYTGAELLEKTKGKREHPLVDPYKEITVDIKIPQTYLRSPLLPLVPYGDKGFYHEDVREVLGIKLMRMVGPKHGFARRDVIDFYNMMQVGALDIKKDAELLRTIAMAYTASNMASDIQYHTSLALLEPTDANIEEARDPQKGLNIAAQYKEELREAYKTVYDMVRQVIYPPSRSTLPPKLAGDIHMTLDELNFVTKINGVEQLPGGFVRQCAPQIDAGLIVSDALEKQYKGLRGRIENNHVLQQNLHRAQINAQIGNDGAPSFNDGGFGAGF